MIKFNIFVVVIVFLFLSCDNGIGTGENGTQIIFSPDTRMISNSIIALGIVGASVSSSNEGIATAEISYSWIEVTSVAVGTAVITVLDISGNNSATINIRVAETGLISEEAITRFVDIAIISNNIETLGFIATEVRNSVGVVIAVAEIDSGEIRIAPYSVGATTITVSDTSRNNFATINVAVSESGLITIEGMTKNLNQILGRWGVGALVREYNSDFTFLNLNNNAQNLHRGIYSISENILTITATHHWDNQSWVEVTPHTEAKFYFQIFRQADGYGSDGKELIDVSTGVRIWSPRL